MLKTVPVMTHFVSTYCLVFNIKTGKAEDLSFQFCFIKEENL